MKRLGKVEVDTDEEEFKYLIFANGRGELKVVNPKKVGFFRMLIIELLFG